MGSAARAGVSRFCVVTGYLAEKIERALPASRLLAGLDVRFVRNPEWERENGVSVARAAGSVGERFVLLMSDHLFDERVLARLLAEPIADDEVILAVDTRIHNHPTVDLEDVTKVRVDAGASATSGRASPATTPSTPECSSAPRRSSPPSRRASAAAITPFPGASAPWPPAARPGPSTSARGFWVDV